MSRGSIAVAGLTEALADLQDANAAVATAAEEMNAGLGEEDAPTSYTADAEGVADAREAVQSDFDEVEAERDSLVEETAGNNTLSSAGAAGVQKHLGDNIELTEANLTTAEEGVQAEVDADTVVYTKDGTQSTAAASADFELYQDADATGEDNDQLLDLSGTDVEKSGDITINLAEFDTTANNKDANGGGGNDTIILPDLADYAGTLIISNMILGDNADKGFDTLVASGLADATSAVGVAAGEGDYLTFTLTTTASGSVSFTNVIKAETLYNDLVDDGTIVLDDSNQITEFNGETLGTPVAAPEFVDGVVDSQGAIDLAAFLDGNVTGEAFVDLLQSYGNLKSSASTSGLEKVGYTLADLQDVMLSAQNDLSAARDAKSDAELLDTVRAEINDYLGAGGEDVDANADADADLLGLRSAIITELDKDEVSLSAAVDVKSSDLLIALSGVGSLSDGEAVTSLQPEAPAAASFDGQGTWVKGEEGEGDAEGTFEWIYEPTAEEQALLDALSAVEDRQTLITEASEARGVFEGTELGGQLLAIEGRLEELADAEQAVVDAQQELDDANALIDGLESALADLDTAEQWFADNDYALPVTLDGAESATAEGDIFLFAEDEGSAFSISGFGEEGQDTLYFGGEFSLVSLAELGEDGLEITDRVGDNDTQEIFWAQDGEDLQLFVEADAAAGFDRGSLATEQMTQITLEGFSAEDIANFDGQSLIAGVAPATEETIA